jgi:hypothetical protein
MVIEAAPHGEHLAIATLLITEQSATFVKPAMNPLLRKGSFTTLKLPREGVTASASGDQPIMLKMYLRRSHPSGSVSSGVASKIGIRQGLDGDF